MKVDDYNKYLDIRDKIQSVVDKSEDLFESRMITIGSGALGLSFTMLPFIAPKGDCCYRCIIICAWILITFSLIINLWSHISAKERAKKTIGAIDEKIKQDEPFDSQKINSIISERNKDTEIQNKLSVISLILGILCVLSFALVNFVVKY